jgi:putative ABC transport system permease protein
MLRATLKGLLSRKLRLLLAVTAVVLGVGFVSAANVLTDSLSAGFDNLFQTINQDVAVQVTTEEDTSRDAEPPLLSDADLRRLDTITGVDDVYGDASAEGLIPFNRDTGKAVQTGGAPSLGVGLDPDELADPDSVLKLAEGEAPDTAGEVAITRHTAQVADVGINDTIRVYVPRLAETRSFTVVGALVYTGDRASLGGETLIGFGVPEAQQLFYGKEGVYSGASVSSDGAVSDTELANRVAAAIPDGFTAKTGEQLAEEQASDIKEGLSFLNWFFLVFGFVALLVGIFLIFNTFNIVVAQRSRELALYRALGASRRQVTGAMLLEALIVGAAGSVLGLLFGVGVAAAMRALFGLLGVELPDAGLVVDPPTVLIAFATGITVTVVSALAPAVRASGVPPVAAMRDVVRPDKPLRWLVAGGLLLTAAGAVAIAMALRGMGDATLRVLGLGVLLVFLGVALLSPLLTKPVAGLVGWGLSWGAASSLGRRNALRNPRRTAVTAAALMIGVTLVATLSLLGASFKATATELLNDRRGADVIINTLNLQAPTGKEGFSADKLETVRGIDGVESVVPLYLSVAEIAGEEGFLAATDLAPAARLFAVTAKQGQVRDLAGDEAVVDTRTAEDNSWAVGDRITIRLAKGGDRTYRLVGTYHSDLGLNGVILDSSTSRYFAGDLVNQGYLKLAPDTNTDAVVAEIEKLMTDYPLVSVADRSDLIRQVNQQIDIALNIFNVLLLVAVLIAFLGILNTLLLSIYERTRELGMLRAIGMARRQVKRMIRVESVIMATFGCALGIGLGLALGYAVALALIEEDQLSAVALPGPQLVVFVAVGVIAGLVAAWWPAFRASRLNVLEAIAYE